MNFEDMTKKQLKEESLIDLAYHLLTQSKETQTLQTLMDDIRKMTGITVKEMDAKMPQFYTDMNIDGRFLALNDGLWGLREWYPVDQIEEETAPVVKTRKKKKKDDYEDDDILDEVFEEDYEELGEEDLDEEEEEEDDEEEVEGEELLIDLDEVEEEEEDDLLDAEGLELIDEDLELDDDEEEEEEV